MSTSQTANTIDVNQLTKRYDRVTALDAISFSVKAGEIVGFLGPNGAGKTTTLRILTGIIAPSSGNVTIDGLDVTAHSLEVRKRIGYVPEQVSLYNELRVEEYLNFRSALKLVPKTARRTRLQQVVERCRLESVIRKTIGRLSKGFRQRVALADALIGDPKILILDEPTVGLDPHQIRQTRELIMELGRSTTILLSTHILPEVEMLCRKVIIIHQGKIVSQETPEELQQRLRGTKQIRAQIKAQADLALKTLQALRGVEHVRLQGQEDDYCVFAIETSGEDIRESIFRTAVKENWVLRELAPERASLEDVFISLTRQETEEEVE